MTLTQPILDAGMAVLRSYLPGEHEEDPRIVQAIYEAMCEAMLDEPLGGPTLMELIASLTREPTKPTVSFTKK